MTKALNIVALNEIKIDKGIPDPPRRGRSNKYPWAQMAIGDSFAVPRNVGIESFRRISYAAAKAHGFKFSVGKHDAGFRCWRIA